METRKSNFIICELRKESLIYVTFLWKKASQNIEGNVHLWAIKAYANNFIWKLSTILKKKLCILIFIYLCILKKSYGKIKISNFLMF